MFVFDGFIEYGNCVVCCSSTWEDFAADYSGISDAAGVYVVFDVVIVAE